ncbi:MAG: hypothetical protein WAO83_17130, partial [Fuerstiella sp.]
HRRPGRSATEKFEISDAIGNNKEWLPGHAARLALLVWGWVLFIVVLKVWVFIPRGSVMSCLKSLVFIAVGACSTMVMGQPPQPPPLDGGGENQSVDTVAGTAAVTITTSPLGNGVHSLDAQAVFTASVPSSSVSTVIDSDLFVIDSLTLATYSQLDQSFRFTLSPGQSATWTLDSAGAETSTSGEYAAMCSVNAVGLMGGLSELGYDDDFTTVP